MSAVFTTLVGHLQMAPGRHVTSRRMRTAIDTDIVILVAFPDRQPIKHTIDGFRNIEQRLETVLEHL